MSVIFTSVHCFVGESMRDVSVIFTSIHCSLGESIEMYCDQEIHEEVGVKV